MCVCVCVCVCVRERARERACASSCPRARSPVPEVQGEGRILPDFVGRRKVPRVEEGVLGVHHGWGHNVQLRDVNEVLELKEVLVGFLVRVLRVPADGRMREEWEKNGRRMGEEWDKNETRMGEEWEENEGRMREERREGEKRMREE